MASREQAQARGLKHYIGAICQHHPELVGEQRTASGNLPQLQAEGYVYRLKVNLENQEVPR